ncbi:MAG: tRNA pseudouridine(55) synthase TruB [Clostridia bacterium]|nr:tRNA pseudouridine(55) synthase TruB [Clostridia bacterium]
MLGFLNVYKPSDMTSSAVVQKLKKKFHIDKIGHMGTLDPMACGVLPIAIGKATRLFDFSLNKTKKYIAIFDFSYTTDSLDATGSIIQKTDKVITSRDVLNIIPNCVGNVSQVPPNFSAKNVNGKRAYTLARQGIEFELKPKDVQIYDIKLLEQVSVTQFKFEITCSSGTYIRSIARDMATSLGVVGCMIFLERVETGEFSKDSSTELESILCSDSLSNFLISPTQAFSNVPVCNINKEQFEDLINGKKFSFSRFNTPTFIVYASKLVGLAKENVDYLSLSAFLYEEE